MPPAIAIVIPARLESTRLPRKMLLRRTGKPLIQHTYEMATSARLGPVYVATDSDEISSAVRSFGGDVLMTGQHESGTMRVAAAVADSGWAQFVSAVINVQGDEPELDTAILHRLVESLNDHDIATPATPIVDYDDLIDPNVVKVVCGPNDRAMYFSRSPIPHTKRPTHSPFGLRHLGVYAYRIGALAAIGRNMPNLTQQLCDMGTTEGSPSILSLATMGEENLEQLSWLFLGLSIGVIMVDSPHRGIDTADDYGGFVNRVVAGLRK